MRHHRCDPRSDEQCEACAQRQRDEEREADWPRGMPKPPPYKADDEGREKP